MSRETEATDILDRAGEFLTTGLVGENSSGLQTLSVESYRALAAGEPVTDQALAARTGLSEPDVEHLLAAHPASSIDRDDDGAIVAFNGLCLSPTPHRFEVDGRRLYTWCVFDALFLPQVLGKVARLSTRCPVGGDGIEVEIAIDRLQQVHPTGIVMSMVAPDREACGDDLRGAFCNRVSFFRDRETFARASDGRGGVIGLDAEAAMALALRRNRLRYPDLDFSTTVEPP